MVEDDDSIVNANNNNIYIQPLDDLQGIDNDSGDLDNVSIHNLPGSQLRAPFDIKVRSEDDFNKYIKRSKKWTWPLFAFYLDVSAQNTWLFYRKSAEYNSRLVDQLTLKRDIVRVYLMRHKQDRALGRPISGRGLSVNKEFPSR
ncbi:hypothetical protein RRG08_007994 [Elysia crispata]|uniref:PiggyBac transposable element-derived protein domain-containing protein n=1 Tax=Elysia crispata TaxID=231223 RepID=A0AAE1E897_9GAST|nr:hypothetical protein RRG08_007994 [Elysia crispata]